MQRNNPMFLAGPGGRFDLANPATQQMVRHVSANPADAPKYGASLAEIFQLQKMLERMATPMPKPQTMTVYDELKNAALQQASGGMLGQPQQAPQMPPQMQQPQMQQAPQDQGLAQLAQQQPMAAGGLTSLPVHNFNPANYAGGGIVAFTPGGLTDDEVRNKIIEASPADQYAEQPDDTTSLGRFRAIQNQLENIRSQYANQPDVDIRDLYTKAGITGELGAARQKQLEDLKAQEPERRQDALRNFLMTTGFGMAAAAAQPGVPRSGGILGALTQPLSVGAAQAAPGYLAEQKELRNLMTQRDKELAELENQRRAEARGDVRVNQEFKDKKEARLEKLDEKIINVKGSMASALGQQEVARYSKTPHDQEVYAAGYVKSARAKGDTTTPTEILEQKGRDEYLKLKGMEAARNLATITTAGSAAAKTEQAYSTAVQKEVNDILADLANPQAREYNKLIKEKKYTEANEYLQQMLEREKIKQGQTSAPRAPAAAPSAAPAAAPTAARPTAPRVPYDKIQGAPSGGRYGQYVAGRGWEIMDSSGKLAGYAQ